MLGQLHLIRAFEETVLELAAEGLVHGPAHSSIGQEGGAVGSIASLRSTDAVNGSHRGHHQFLAKALTHVTKGSLTLDGLVTPAVAEVLQRTLAEILGLAQGYCGGRGGSMHLQWLEAGALGTNAIVGGGVPMAAGNAWAQRQSSPGGDPRPPGAPDGSAIVSGARQAAEGSDLTVTYFGDGAVNIGSVLETLNLASAWKLPLCFFMENNGYAVSTTVAEATGEPRLSARALGFGITAWRVDGMDPLAVHLAMERAAARLRAGEGPVVDRGARLPVLPPERPVPRLRVRLPDQGGRGAMARPRPAGPGRARDDQARADRRGRRGGRPRPGRSGDAGGRRRAHRARPGPGRVARGQGGHAAHPPGTVAGPGLRRRGHPRRPGRSWPGRGPPSARRSPGRSGAGSSSRRWRP